MEKILNFLAPHHEKDIREILKIGEEIRGKKGMVYLIGIGGSSLPAEVFLHSCGKDDIEVIHGYSDEKLKESLSGFSERDHFLFVSKSGKTFEILLAFYSVLKSIKNKGMKPSEMCTIVTSQHSSPLRNEGEKNKIPVVDFPENVSGRFSLYTPGVTLPAAIAGEKNLYELLKGAEKVREKFQGDGGIEPLILFLQIIMDWNRRGKREMVLWAYDPLERKMSRWLRQLFSESLGKRGASFEPSVIIAHGPYDQHSLLQQFIEGNDRRFFIFYKKSPLTCMEEEIIFYDKKISFKKALEIQKEAIKGVLQTLGKNIVEVEFSPSPEGVSEIMGIFMVLVSLAGFLQGIDPFNQPAVELGKIETEKILKNL